MNLAVQNRHKQLERWRKNEASQNSATTSADECESSHFQNQDPTPTLSKQQLLSTSSKPTNLSNVSSTDTNEFISTTKSTPNHISNLIDNSTTTSSSSTRNSSHLCARETYTCDKNNNNSNNNFNNNNNNPSTLTTLASSRKNSSSRKSKCDYKVKFDNSTLFANACACGDIDECDRLLESKLVDIDVATNDGLTGLHEAVISGDTNTVKYLLSKGANINCSDNEGWTPLHAAASLNQLEIVDVLLKHGASATIVNCDNLLAIDLARSDEVKQLVSQYLDGLDIEALHRQEERLIQMDINYWLQVGKYDERSHPKTNATVLHVIASKGYVKLMKQILSSQILRKQINIEAEDFEGFTPLLAASFWGQDEIVELLIENGANISAKATNGFYISSSVLQKYQQNKSQQQTLQSTKPTASTKDLGSLSSITSTKDTSGLNLTNLKAPQSSNTTLSKHHYTNKSIDSGASDSSCVCPEDASNSSALSTSNISKQPPTQPQHPSPSPQPSLQPTTTPKSNSSHLVKSRSLDTKQQHPKDYITKNELDITKSLDELLATTSCMTDDDIRKCYNELFNEHEKLRKRLNDNEQEWEKKQRKLERKISELEEENKLLVEYKQEIQRLKDENSALIRVVSKLTKQS